MRVGPGGNAAGAVCLGIPLGIDPRQLNGKHANGRKAGEGPSSTVQRLTNGSDQTRRPGLILKTAEPERVP